MLTYLEISKQLISSLSGILITSRDESTLVVNLMTKGSLDYSFEVPEDISIEETLKEVISDHGAIYGNDIWVVDDSTDLYEENIFNHEFLTEYENDKTNYLTKLEEEK